MPEPTPSPSSPSEPEEQEVKLDLRPPKRSPFMEPIDWSDPEVSDGYDHMRRLVRDGLLGVSSMDMPWERCSCGHLKPAHDAQGCHAHRCPCGGFLQDPRYLLE